MGKNKNLISRDKYKEIKRMDHVEMTDFYTGVWQTGFNEGIKAGKKQNRAAVNPEDIKTALTDIRGIGEGRLKLIMERIYKLFESKGE